MNPLAVIILAAGKGSRMGGDIPKVCHMVQGKTMIEHVIEVVHRLEPQRIVVVVGYMADSVKEVVSATNVPGVEFVHQKHQLGTGHAVRTALGALKDFNGDIMIRYGDTPLMSTKTLGKMLGQHRTSGSKATLLTTVVDDPARYGRILRNKNGAIVEVVEDRSCTPEQATIKEINAGAYVYNKVLLEQAIPRLQPNNFNGEYYLTDAVRVLCGDGVRVNGMESESIEEIIGVNTKDHLSTAEDIAVNL